MENVIGGIIAIPMIVLVLFIAFFYLPAFLSKITNTRIRTRGIINTTYSPELFDFFNDEIKEKSVMLFNKMKSTTGSAVDSLKRNKIETVVYDKTKDKIEKLKNLNELKVADIITLDEFKILKDEIFCNGSPTIKMQEQKPVEEIENRQKRVSKIDRNYDKCHLTYQGVIVIKQSTLEDFFIGDEVIKIINGNRYPAPNGRYQFNDYPNYTIITVENGKVEYISGKTPKRNL